MAVPNAAAVFTPEARATDKIQAIIDHVGPDAVQEALIGGIYPGKMTAISYREHIAPERRILVKVSTPDMGYFLIGLKLSVTGAEETTPIGFNNQA